MKIHEKSRRFIKTPEAERRWGPAEGALEALLDVPRVLAAGELEGEGLVDARTEQRCRELRARRANLQGREE